MMAHLVEHVLRKIHAHACRWAFFDDLTVPSAAVTDEDTERWSSESYQRDLDNDAKESGRRTLVLIGLGALLAAGVYSSGVAKADPVDDVILQSAPAVCAYLDKNPTVQGVEDIVTSVWKQGYDPRLAGEIVGRSVVGFCPRHMPEVKGFIAKWGKPVTAGVGGRLYA